MVGKHYMLDEVLEMMDDDAEPGSDEESEDLVVEKAMDVEVSTEYDNLDAAQEAEDEHLDQGDVVAGPSGSVADVAVTLQELKAYIGFCILMGLVSLPELSDYWTSDPYFHYAPIAERISRHSFMEITRYLHFTNNADLIQRGEPGYDRLGNTISRTLTDCYNVSKEIVVDEAMIPFQGRSSLKQYLPKKPVKRGIKVWCLADSSNGYVQRFDLYTGQSGEESDDDSGLGARVVKKPFQSLEGQISPPLL